MTQASVLIAWVSESQLRMDVKLRSAWQSFTFFKWVSLTKSHMGAAIMRFINRLNIQTSWLRKTKTCVRFLSWQQDTSQLGPRRFSGTGSWLCTNYTRSHRENSHPALVFSGFLHGDGRSRCQQIPSASFLTEATTATDAKIALKMWVPSPQFPQGRGD